MQQIIFKDLKSGSIQAGFMTADGAVYCGCCGKKYRSCDRNKRFQVLRVSSTWADIQAETACKNEQLYEYLNSIQNKE